MANSSSRFSVLFDMMPLRTALACAILLVSCQGGLKPTKPIELVPSLQSVQGNSAMLVVEIDFLHPGDWLVSPRSSDSLFGHVEFGFLDASVLAPVGDMVADPPAVMEHEPMSQIDLWVHRMDTKLALPVEAMVEGDFQVRGGLFFVLEPRCVPYELRFEVLRVDGEWSLSPHTLSEAWPEDC